ncbi:hypothetical protein JTB14_020728 [Gonioctena quinquepunctata]|nr:hypothetical protein JTB14_020728 [Gonioctena quinquepunctata]
MEANLLCNPNKQVLNATSHIIKQADKNTIQSLQANDTTKIFQENPDTYTTWESDYEKAMKELDETPLQKLINATNKLAAVPTAYLDEATNEDEPMETEQIQSTVISHKEVEGEASGMNNTQEKTTAKNRRTKRIKNVEENSNKKLLERRASYNSIDTPVVEKSEVTIKKGRTEPHTPECIAPIELGEFPSHYHVENRLEELQKKIHDRAHELTESAMKEYITFDPNIQGYNIDQIKKLIREDMYNQNVDRLTEINKYELTRLKSMTEANMEFLKSPKKKKKEWRLFATPYKR